ncbi:hypothetical protein FBU30_010455 [Linnemannia zychae]|nr:hypothetical protein FBU30_010455 [Linnemannia zychae]
MIPVSKQKAIPAPTPTPLPSDSVSVPQSHAVVVVTQGQERVGSQTAVIVQQEESLQHQVPPEPNGSSSSSRPQPTVPSPLITNKVLDRFRNRLNNHNNSDNNTHNSNEHFQPNTEEPYQLPIQTVVSEPESPSPILAAWVTPSNPNPDYLAPYHPSLHKNVQNWSHILLDQLRQKSAASPPELGPPQEDAGKNGRGREKAGEKVFSIQAALSSSVPGIAPAAPLTFEGISNGPITAAATAYAAAGSSSTTVSATARRIQVNPTETVEKHFLFQTHHRQKEEQQRPQQSSTGRKYLSRTQTPVTSPLASRHSTSSLSLGPGAGPGRRIKRRTIRTSKRLMRFFRRLFRSTRSEHQQQQSLSAEEQQFKYKSKVKSNPLTNTTTSGTKGPPPVVPPPHNNNDANTTNTAAVASASTKESSFNYLVVSEDDDDPNTNNNKVSKSNRGQEDSLAQTTLTNERQEEVVARDAEQATNAVSPAPPESTVFKAVPKMLRVITKIKNQVQKTQEVAPNPGKQAAPTPAPVPEATNPDRKTATTTITATAISPSSTTTTIVSQKQYFNGARIHPKLLELYDITDRVLGAGTFATVHEIRLKSTGQKFALKIILKRSLQGKGAMLDTEISVLSKVRHPNCVSLLEMFETEDAVYLVTDLAEGGELFEQLLQKGCYTEGDAARLVREILLGVEYLHSMEIVHRDLKPENLLFLDKSENARLLITDFGLSKVLTSGNDVLMTACGTPGYVAPEVLEQIGHGKPVDMWSLGVIAYTLLCGYTPFWGENQQALFENIISGQYQFEEEYWKDISPLAKNFINTLLVRPAEIRSTATQALAHPWFRAVLDQDLSAPASPQDSVNLLPAVRKNFNARTVFKKAVRAVGILRRMQAAPPQQQQPQQQKQQSPQSQQQSLSDANANIPCPTKDSAPLFPISGLTASDSIYVLPSPPPNNSFVQPNSDLVVTVNGTAGWKQAQQLEQERCYFGGKNVKTNAWSFHEIVSAAMMNEQAGFGEKSKVGCGEGNNETAERSDSEDHLQRVSHVLEDLTATREP